MNDVYRDLLEDTHLQLDLGDEYQQLWDYDVTLRVNDEGSAYTGFDIFDCKNQNHIIFVPFRQGEVK